MKKLRQDLVPLLFEILFIICCVLFCVWFIRVDQKITKQIKEIGIEQYIDNNNNTS